MRKLSLLFVAAFFLLFAACEDQQPEPQMQDQAGKAEGAQVLNFRAHLNGEQEVADVSTNATGQAIFKLSKDGTALHYKLMVANIDNVHMAHIHMAPAGKDGGVVAWLYPDGPPPVMIPGTYNGILAQGTLTQDDLRGALEGQPLAALVAKMLEGQTYVNVHTMQYPGGEIRGQIQGSLPGNDW